MSAIKYRLCRRSFPYVLGDDNLPHFYDPITKKDTFDLFINKYFEDIEPVPAIGYNIITQDQATINIKWTSSLVLSKSHIEISFRGEVFYYFIVRWELKGLNVVKLDLTMDYWATYWRSIIFRPAGVAKVLRTHKDRYIKGATTTQYWLTPYTYRHPIQATTRLESSPTVPGFFEAFPGRLTAQSFINFKGEKLGGANLAKNYQLFEGISNTAPFSTTGEAFSSVSFVESTWNFRLLNEVKAGVRYGVYGNIIADNDGQFIFNNGVPALTNSYLLDDRIEKLEFAQFTSTSIKFTPITNSQEFYLAMINASNRVSGDIESGGWFVFTFKEDVPVNTTLDLVNFQFDRPDKDQSEVFFNYTENSPFMLNDERMKQYAANYYEPIKYQLEKGIIIDGNLDGDGNVLKNFSQNAVFSQATPSGSAAGTNYCYAIITYLDIRAQNDENGVDKNPINPDVDWFKSSAQTDTYMPLLIAPLNKDAPAGFDDYQNNTLNFVETAGNDAVINIITSPIALISNQAWDNAKIVLTDKQYKGLGDLVCYKHDEIIADFAPYITENILEEGEIDPKHRAIFKKDRWTFDTPIGYKTPYNIENEPKLNATPHTWYELLWGEYSRQFGMELSLSKDELLFRDRGNNLEYSDNKNWVFNIGALIQPNAITYIFDCVSGNYRNMSDYEKSAMLCNSTFDFPTLSDPYTNYYQNHKNSVSTSQKVFGQQRNQAYWNSGINLAAGLAGSAAINAVSSPVAPLAAGAAAATSVAHFFQGMMNARTQYKIQNEQLDAFLTDTEYNPESIKGISSKDAYSNTLLYKYSNYRANDIKIMPPFLRKKSLRSQHRAIVSDHYRRYGYLQNNSELLSYETMGANRIYYNYWEVHNFKDVLNKNIIPPLALAFFSQLFNAGVRLWNVLESETDSIDMLDYNFENWEVSLLDQ